MPEREIEPSPDSPEPSSSGHHLADEVELPPVRGASETDSVPRPIKTASSTRSEKTPNPVLFYGSALLIATLLALGISKWTGSSAEEQHANWKHVAAATSASTDSASQLVLVDDAGSSQTQDTIEITRADINTDITKHVREQLKRNNIDIANAALQSAQKLPQSGGPDVQLPKIEPDSQLASDLEDGKKQLFNIELFDSCDEDGDAVEVLVNGELFTTVPIMNEGTMLCIPLSTGNNSIVIRGARDGGGGVTLAFRTSRGDFFARHMRLGQEYRMGVVVK